MNASRKLCFTLAALVLVGCGGSSGSGADGTPTAGASAQGGAGNPSGGAAGSLSAAAGASSKAGASAGTSGSGSGGAGSAGAGSAGASNAGASSGGAGAGSSAGGASNGGATAGGAGASGASTGGGGTSSAGAANGGASGAAGGTTAGAPFKGVANSPCAARTLLNVSWYYNWEQSETEACTNGKGGAFVPMIWGHTGAEQTAASIQSAVAGFVSKGYKYVLGFNEPDNSGQSNIAVAPAIALLPSFDNAAIAVGTPATQANTTGQTWFKSYMADVAASTTLRADFIAIHWYGWNAGSCDAAASQLESYVKYAEGLPGNRPIWITEWGCLNLSAPTAAGVVAFYKGALAVFAKHPRLVRYAWYPWSTNCELNNSDGSLTDLGTAYAAAPATK
jgi:Glycosyl hydrolase catalytic core